ncbi:hypothetical protein R3W88_014691 [Solanum pinnatisectum]|uniref:Large ribosomal subunit protein uL6 alpha-beta domain-containing protein n=1 Tax=Solanum pinnatisectum TaxID=50273 RepID=A0AAV9KTU2_9SOLN|nr:hypothetical protein R3W88_014691 [Solanum pinnatisectum]
MTVPSVVHMFCFKPSIICCTKIDEEKVQQFAASLRSCKRPKVYKGKSICTLMKS